jgi:hypothetical protein
MNDLEVSTLALPDKRADDVSFAMIVVGKRDNEEPAGDTSTKHNTTPLNVAERCASAAAGSGSVADAVGSQLQAVVRRPGKRSRVLSVLDA